jgi:hypothetical protein
VGWVGTEQRSLKKNIFAFNLTFVVVGAATTATLLHDLAYGEAFLAGGVIGLLYMRLLANQVDSTAPTNTRANQLLGPLLTAPARFLLVTPSYVCSFPLLPASASVERDKVHGSQVAGMGVAAMKATTATVLVLASEPGVVDVDPRVSLLLGTNRNEPIPRFVFSFAPCMHPDPIHGRRSNDAGVSGFFMYKLSVVCASLMPQSSRDT